MTNKASSEKSVRLQNLFIHALTNLEPLKGPDKFYTVDRTTQIDLLRLSADTGHRQSTYRYCW